MRAAPACQVSLQCFGAWRAAVLALTALGVASTLAWVLTREPPLDTALVVAAGLAMLIVAAIGASLYRVRGTHLRWDGRAWHLGPIGNAAAGDVRVAIDLGPWLMLRFTPAMAEARPRAIWLPVQRRGLDAQWHALRSALYSPRPVVVDDDASIGP